MALLCRAATSTVGITTPPEHLARRVARYLAGTCDQPGKETIPASGPLVSAALRRLHLACWKSPHANVQPRQFATWPCKKQEVDSYQFLELLVNHGGPSFLKPLPFIQAFMNSLKSLPVKPGSFPPFRYRQAL